MSNVDVVKTDILIVGGGPAGLATSIRLADLLKEKGLQKRILLIDKGSSIGSHIISGAVLKPEVFKELLPGVDRSEIPLDAAVKEDRIFFLSEKNAFRLPLHPPYMGNKSNYTASLSAICRFLAEKAEEKGVEIYSGFSVSELLYDNSGKVSGAKTIDTGIDHHGNRMENFQAGSHIEASLTILAEGSRGSLSKELINKFNLQQGRNPQLYSLGCKEL